MEKFIKYGGIHFTNNVPPEEINIFVKNLPTEQKDSLFKVVKELETAGLITLDLSRISTADDETIDYQKT